MNDIERLRKAQERLMKAKDLLGEAARDLRALGLSTAADRYNRLAGLIQDFPPPVIDNRIGPNFGKPKKRGTP